jgi:photosystem II stability/assembly factor-like uncharacterized protein
MAKAGLLFIGTDDGLVLFSNPNNIGRWLRIGQPFRGQRVGAVWPLPDNPLVVLAAVEGAGLQRSEDGGQSWQPVLDAPVLDIAGRPTAAPALYAATSSGVVYRGDVSGASWAECARGDWPATGTARLLADHSGADTVFIGRGDGSIWETSNGGASWRLYGEHLPAPVADLAEARDQPGTLYAVAGGALYRCGGGTPEMISTETAAGPVTALAGKTPVVLLALAQGGIARSEDGGTTWTTAEQADIVEVLAPAPYHIDTAFAGGSGGTLTATSDRGRSWEMLKQGLPPIRAIAAARLV